MTRFELLFISSIDAHCSCLDETHPGCTRCIRAKLECGGYQKEFNIIDERPRIERALASARAQQDNLQQEELQVVRDAGGKLYRSRAAATLYSPKGPPSVPATLPLTAFSQNIFISFLLEHMFSAVLGNNGEWIALALKSNTSSLALSALATMFYGRAHRQPELMSRATRHYGKALPSLRDDLSGSDGLSYKSLLSVTALTMYEVCIESL